MGIEYRIARSVLCVRCASFERGNLVVRGFASSAPSKAEAELEASSSRPPLDPFNVTTPRQERRLLRETNKVPIGSRRRRTALRSDTGLPFEQLPYQCFQEARKFLLGDRAIKLQEIQKQRERIERLKDTVAIGEDAEKRKQHRLESMVTRLEELKISADINDPLVKKRFEDGQGDLSKPIYRHLADQKWRDYGRKILVQRIEQMHIVPDVLPSLDPIVETVLAFPAPSTSARKLRYAQPGEFVESRVSEVAPNLRIQPFTKEEKLVSIAVINPDVPNVEKDGFDFRCHFLACNIPISATNNLVKLRELEKNQVLIPWFPAYAQKGAPYQRLSILILEQSTSVPNTSGSAMTKSSKLIDVEATKAQEPRYTTRDGFNIRSFVDKFGLTPIGANLFRTQWDDGTAGVMRRAGVVGWNVEFKRMRVDPMPYKRLKGERFR